MNKKLKSQLKAAFDAPAPTRKTEFLQSINFPKASRFDFILGQIGYIRKRVWIIYCLLIAAVLAVLHFNASDNALLTVWMLSSGFPFIALAAVTEIARSISYNMEELEISCKYSLADIILVRLGTLGSISFVLFASSAFFLTGKTGLGVLRLGMYFVTPFIITCWLSFFTLNRLRSRETLYVCGGISCFVSAMSVIFIRYYDLILSNRYLQLWRIIFVLSLLGFAKETVKLIKKTEEFQWNLSLTD